MYAKHGDRQNVSVQKSKFNLNTHHPFFRSIFGLHLQHCISQMRISVSSKEKRVRTSCSDSKLSICHDRENIAVKEDQRSGYDGHQPQTHSHTVYETDKLAKE